MGTTLQSIANMAGQEESPQLSGDMPLTGLGSIDAELLTELREKTAPWVYSEHTGTTYANPEIAGMVRPEYSINGLQKLEGFLRETGALHIPIGHGSLNLDGEIRDVPYVPATELGTTHGDMSSMVYVRDHIQTARIYSDNPFGHDLLLSGLDLLSTDSQLSCFEIVINHRGREAGQSEWPKISLLLHDLEGVNPNNWRNIQDTVQMAAHATLDSIERGLLKPDELTDRHKKMLGLIVPFLDAVGYPTYPNSGSWEEVATNRTSVMGIETALLHKIKTLTERDEAGVLSFLQAGYQQQTPSNSTGDFLKKLEGMVRSGLQEIGRRLPFESPDYDKDSVEYREADATLAYLLMYDVPRLLERYQVPIGFGSETQDMRAQDIEGMVLGQLRTLMDTETGGMKRYQGDSYLRTDFLTNEKQLAVNGIKQRVKAEANGGEIDLSKKQRLRGELLNSGPEASWSHPVSQVSAWAARRAQECLYEGRAGEAGQYVALSTEFLNQALRMVTGENQAQVALQSDGTCGVQPVTAYRVPECMTSCTDEEGIVRFASPHTPLNWGTAQLHEAIGLLTAAMEQQNAHFLSR